MSIWTDLLFLHGHLCTPRAVTDAIANAIEPDVSPSAPAPRGLRGLRRGELRVVQGVERAVPRE